MILDKLENRIVYTKLNPRIIKGLQYLAATDFSKITPGKYELDGANLFAVISDYRTKLPEDCKLEAHRKYIDIQFLASGCENIGTAILNNQVPSVEYNEEKDVIFFKEEVSFIRLDAGMFAIFYPGDLHMPGVMCDEMSDVRKVVVKVRV